MRGAEKWHPGQVGTGVAVFLFNYFANTA